MGEDASADLSDSSLERLPKQSEGRYVTELETLVYDLNEARKQFSSNLKFTSGEVTIKGEVLKSIDEQLGSFGDRVQGLRSSLNRTPEVVAVRLSDLKMQQVVVDAWPQDTVSTLIIYIGTAIFGAGSALYFAEGYPSTGARLVPSVAGWTAGLMLLLLGFVKLREWQRERMTYFRRRFNVPKIGMSDIEMGGYWAWVFGLVGIVAGAAVMYVILR